MRRSLDRLFRPQTIAVFGGREAAEVIRQCARMGYAGAIYPVHPDKIEIEGWRCYRSVAALPQAPDASFIAVNRHTTVDVLRELAARGAGGAVCYAAGFKEIGEAGLQQQLVEAAAEMPILGPNCYGLINYLDGALLWPDQHGGRRVERGVALITQSGNIALNLTMQRRALPVAYVVTLGNQAQTGLSDCIEAALDDPRVSAIGLYIEGIDSIAAFEQALRRARARGVPVVALKTGRSENSARLTLSHTASLAGKDDLADAFFARLGVARVHSLTALLETLKLLHVFGPLPGNCIASLSCSGGEASLVADAIEGRALVFAPLDPEQAESVKRTVSPLVTVSNPFDYHTFDWNNESRLHTTFSVMLGCHFDLTLLILDFPRGDRCSAASWEPSVAALAGASRETGARAAVLATLPENLPEADAERLLLLGVAPLVGVDDALCAVEAAAFIGAAWRQTPTKSASGPAQSAEPASPRRAWGREEMLTLDEWLAKQRLAAYGVPIPAGRRVPAGEAGNTAIALGFPVVVKAVGEHLAHKTELGAVVLNLTDAAAVEQAVARMRSFSDELIVEAMIGDGVAELIVGVNRDPQFGLYLLLGSGGVLIELIGDSQVLLLPTTCDEIVGALRCLRVFKLLQGYRGRPQGDIDAAVAAILAVADFALAHADTLLELDINPLIVRPAGCGVIAADALIRIFADPEIESGADHHERSAES